MKRTEARSSEDWRAFERMPEVRVVLVRDGLFEVWFGVQLSAEPLVVRPWGLHDTADVLRPVPDDVVSITQASVDDQTGRKIVVRQSSGRPVDDANLPPIVPEAPPAPVEPSVPAKRSYQLRRHRWHGEVLTIDQLAARVGMVPRTLRNRLREGWPLARAVVPPGKN